MSAEPFVTEHLDLWTSAVTSKSTSERGTNSKIELTGIKKLRELILELAMRGKLVTQHADEMSAITSIEKISQERKRLVESGEIQKPKTLPAIAEVEQPFELPNGWQWFRIGSCLDFRYGKSLSAKERDGSGKVDVFGSNGIVGSHTANLVEDPCIIVGRKGSAGALNKTYRPSWTTDVAYYVIPPNGMSFDFCFLLLKSLHLEELGKGIKPGVNRNEAYAVVAALPPEQEQHRIVQKVDEFMALCDRLEQQTHDQHAAHETLVDALLDTLTQSKDADELADNWARLAAHFDTLFTTERSIERVTQAIIRLGVTGQLMTQGSSDESAAVLLSKIAAEKKRLLSEGKIRKPRKIPLVSDSEKSFELPAGWAWARFQDFAEEVSTGPFGSMVHKSDYVTNGVPLINPSHMISGVISEDISVSVSPKKAAELSSYALEPGDVVMARRGEVGRCALVTERQNGWLCGTGSFMLRFHEQVDRSFVLNLFLTQEIRQYLSGNSVGTTMTNLNHGILNKLPIAVPPASEQQRIVKKINQLLAICDQLKARLNQSDETRRQMADAVVEQAI